MEQFQNAFAMLDMLYEPAFCVCNGVITKVNAAASALLIECGAPIQPLLYTGAEEYAALAVGCLYLTLSLSGHAFGAQVSRMQEFDVFCIDQSRNDAHLQAMALAAKELREPLSNVMTIADKLFPNAANGDSNTQEQLSHINRGLFQMLRIIGNMSDATNYVAESGKRQEFRDVCAVVDEVFHRAASLAEHTGVALSYSGYPESVYTPVDTQKLERMILNILSNAIKFTPAGGAVTAKLTRRGAKMYLSVSDNGCGIAENLRGTVFSRYTRAPGIEDGRYGLGLGMVLIRSTAALHGGTVLVDHPENQGTRITVSLAIRKGAAVVQSPRIRIDYAGERDHGLIELSDVLPAQLYDPDIVN